MERNMSELIDTTLNKHAWLEKLKEYSLDIHQANDGLNLQNVTDVDFRTSYWFAHKIQVPGYMPGPCALCVVDGVQHQLAAKTRKFTDFKEFLQLIKDRPGKIYPYMFMWYPNLPVTFKLDPDTFEMTLLDCPVIEENFGFWKIRYAELE